MTTTPPGSCPALRRTASFVCSFKWLTRPKSSLPSTRQTLEKNKVRRPGASLTTRDVLRLIQEFRDKGLYVGSVVITQYSPERRRPVQNQLEHRDIKVYRHYCIEGYPSNVPLIVSDEATARTITLRPPALVIITAPGRAAGKNGHPVSPSSTMRISAASRPVTPKFETFPIWNLPLKHPVKPWPTRQPPLI